MIGSLVLSAGTNLLKILRRGESKRRKIAERMDKHRHCKYNLDSEHLS